MEAIRTAGRTTRAIIFLVSMSAFLWIIGSIVIPSFLDFVEQDRRAKRVDLIVPMVEMDRTADALCGQAWASGNDPRYDNCEQYEGIFPGSPGFSETTWTQYRGEAFQWVCAKPQDRAPSWCNEYAGLIPGWSTFDKGERASWEEANWRYMCAPLARLRVMKHNPFNRDFRARLNHLRWCDRFTSDLDGFADLDISRKDFLYTRLAEIDRREASWF